MVETDSRAHILMVDDEPNILSALRRTLRPLKIPLLSATNGKEALRLVEEREVAVIICDQRLPEMTGPEILQAVGKLSPDTQRLTLTGYSDIAMIAEAINLGRASRFLLKPFDSENLRQIVRESYGQYKALALHKKLTAQAAEQNARIKDLSERLINHSRQQRQTLADSWQLQRALLLDPPPADLRGVSLAAKTLPARDLDGDFVFFHRFNERLFDMVIGDVMGKGILAALTGASLRGYFMREWGRAEGAGLQTGSVGEIIAAVNQAMLGRLVDFSSFISLFYGRIDLKEQRFSYVDCGGVKPLLFAAAKEEIAIIEGDNAPLGVPEAGNDFAVKELSLATGDGLFFYSDGVIEEVAADSDACFGIARLQAVVKEARQLAPALMLEKVFQSLRDFHGRVEHSDDLTCVALQFCQDNCPLPDAAAEVVKEIGAYEFTSDPAELERLHAILNAAYAGEPALAGNELKQGAITLAVHEAFVNIIKHGYRNDATKPIWLDIHCHAQMLHIVLYDYGIAFAPATVGAPDFSGGRDNGFGCHLIANLADSATYFIDHNARNALELSFNFQTNNPGKPQEFVGRNSSS